MDRQMARWMDENVDSGVLLFGNQTVSLHPSTPRVTYISPLKVLLECEVCGSVLSCVHEDTNTQSLALDAPYHHLQTTCTAGSEVNWTAWLLVSVATVTCHKIDGNFCHQAPRISPTPSQSPNLLVLFMSARRPLAVHRARLSCCLQPTHFKSS